jgi:membrane associated rhomboid family serine protease
MGMNRRCFAWVTVALILANFTVFLFTVDEGMQIREEVAMEDGFVPVDFFEGRNPGGIVSHMFLHADVLHLLSNMLALLWLGFALESRIGNARFLAVYLACGLLAALIHGMVDPVSPVPAVGASAAIFGVMGTLALLYPTSFVFVLIIPVPVMLIAVFYAFTTISLIQTGDAGPVAHLAHLAGLVSGMGLAFLMEPEDALKGLAIFVVVFLAVVFMIQIL